MKNQSFAYLLLVGFGILSSCVNVTNNSYASDDLYDEANRSVQIAKVQAAKAAKEKKWHWIEGQNQKLFDVAQECGIKLENIHFTCMESKSIFLESKDFVFHLVFQIVLNLEYI